MTKMSETQRMAILRAHEAPTSCSGSAVYWSRGYIVVPRRTMKVLQREGWAGEGYYLGSNPVTTAGLIAAGVDMGAIEDEAAAEHRVRTAVANGTARRAPATLERSVEQDR